MRVCGGTRFVVVVLVLMFCAVFILGGCTRSVFEEPTLSMFGAKRPDERIRKELIEKYSGRIVREYDEFETPSSAAAMEKRNEIMKDMIYLINGFYNDYKQDLYEGRAGASFVTDVMVLGVNSAAALAGGESAKTILSVVSAGIVGTRTSFRENVFRNQATEAMTLKMDALRDEQLKLIYERMAQDYTKYRLEDGLIDLQELMDRGTVLSAVVAIAREQAPKTEQAQKEREKAEDKLKLSATDYYVKLIGRIDSLSSPEQRAVYEQAAADVGGAFAMDYSSNMSNGMSDSAAFANAVIKDRTTRSAAVPAADRTAQINERLERVLESQVR